MPPSWNLTQAIVLSTSRTKRPMRREVIMEHLQSNQTQIFTFYAMQWWVITSYIQTANTEEQGDTNQIPSEYVNILYLVKYQSFFFPLCPWQLYTLSWINSIRSDFGFGFVYNDVDAAIVTKGEDLRQSFRIHEVMTELKKSDVYHCRLKLQMARGCI